MIALLLGILEAAAGAAWAAHGFFSYPGRHIFFFLEWLFSWRGLVGGYLFVEGALRIAGAVAGEPIGWLPLWAARAIGKALRRPRAQPAAPDRITRVGDELRWVAGTPRDWDALTTIEHDGALYRVARREGDTFVLAPIPEGWIVRRRVRV